jgi:hypothetical protein
MTFRHRTSVALMLQLSFALALAEGLWASTCSPGMTMDMDPAVPEATPEGRSAAWDPMSHMADASAPTDESGNEGSSSAPSDCPLAFLGATGSCASVAAVLVLRFQDLVPPSGNTLPETSPHQTRGSLLASGLFHPPRT